MNTTVLNVMLSSTIAAPSDASSQASDSDNSQFSDELQKAKSQAQSQSTDSTSDKTSDSSTPAQKKHKTTKATAKPKTDTPASVKPSKDANAAKDSQPATADDPATASDPTTNVNAQIAQSAQAVNANVNQASANSQADKPAADQVNSTDLPSAQTLSAKLAAGPTKLKSADDKSPDAQAPAQSGDTSQAGDASRTGLPASKPNVSPFKPAAASTDSTSASSASATHSDPKTAAATTKPDVPFSSILSAITPQTPTVTNHSAAPAIAPANSPSVDSAFSAANHANIVTTVRTQLLPDGGTMQIRLDPPDLGTMQISVTVDSGIVSASFQTSNDQATQLVTHSLSQLKTALESQGVSVERLHVQQTSRSDNSSNDSSSGDRSNSRQQGSLSDSTNQQEQQRRELLRRMWQRVAGNRDELDMVA